jgi:hypothetical protein
MDRLSLVNVFAQDIEALPDFYARVFDLEEETAFRTSIFRALHGGGALLGFNGPQAYELLGLPAGEPGGVARFALTFDVPCAAQVGPRTELAVSLNARLIKGPYATHYGTMQSVLLDIEGNVFRINAAT